MGKTKKTAAQWVTEWRSELGISKEFVPATPDVTFDELKNGIIAMLWQTVKFLPAEEIEKKLLLVNLAERLEELRGRQ